MSFGVERILSGQLTPIEQALADKARTYWDTLINAIDRLTAPNLFVQARTVPRRDRRCLVSRGVVTPWQARAYAHYMMERTFFDQLAAFRFMMLACCHYTEYLRVQAGHAPSYVTKQDVTHFQELAEGFQALVWQHDWKRHVAIVVAYANALGSRVSGP